MPQTCKVVSGSQPIYWSSIRLRAEHRRASPCKQCKFFMAGEANLLVVLLQDGILFPNNPCPDKSCAALCSWSELVEGAVKPHSCCSSHSCSGAECKKAHHGIVTDYSVLVSVTDWAVVSFKRKPVVQFAIKKFL